jgi:hypothetical protein
MIDFKVIDVTPQYAQKLLERKRVNRALNDKRIAMYAKDMIDDAWQLNGETINIDEDGLLCNGEHRLLAVIKANKTVKMCFCFGVKRDVSLYDRGRNRSERDILLIEGWDKNELTRATIASVKLHLSIMNKRKSNSVNEIKMFITENKELLFKAGQIARKYRSGEKQASGMRVNTDCGLFALAFFYALQSGIPEETLCEFAKIVNTGFYNSTNQQAAVVCRNDVLGQVIKTKGGSSERAIAINQLEKAIFDFYNGTPRKKSYGTWKDPLFHKTPA